MRPRREAHFGHRGLQQTLARFVQPAVLAGFAAGHQGVPAGARVAEAVGLRAAGDGHFFARGTAAGAGLAGGELVERYGGNFARTRFSVARALQASCGRRGRADHLPSAHQAAPTPTTRPWANSVPSWSSVELIGGSKSPWVAGTWFAAIARPSISSRRYPACSDQVQFN